MSRGNGGIMEKKQYFLGLDMGTASVGWAVTDINYRLIRAKGKDLWGIREFETAKTSVERRTNRINRRRRQRELVRIGLLKEYFADEIQKVDENFYLRLENSKYYIEEKDERLASKNGVFDDENYKDSDYYAQFPTIFHLRKELIHNENAPYDIRLVFLAILNMFKHRGHFLLQNVEGQNDVNQIQIIYEELLAAIAEELKIELVTDTFDFVIQLLSDKDISRKKKLEVLSEHFNIKKSEKRKYEFLKCLCGLKIDGNLLFDVESESKLSICFSDYAYNDTVAVIELAIGEYNSIILGQMKQIYDHAALAGILKGYNYLSDARVDAYNKHAEDLKLLKKTYRKYKTKDAYDKMFRLSEEKLANYSAYVSSTNSKDVYGNSKDVYEKKYIRRRNMKERSVEKLYDAIKKDLKNIEDEDVMYILDQIEKEQFLPKQMTGENGIIANQIHKKELSRILKNAEEYLPFLKEIDESGLSVSERIVQLFSFQIPYYVGPVSEKSNGWVVRKEAGQVLPWNMNQKIDMGQTSERFIKNLIRQCTYLAGEKVMPKASLKYEKFMVLNEINNIRVNGERLDRDIKQKIYTELFESGKRISRATLCKALMNLGVIISEAEVTGIDKNINSALTSYGKMYAIFGEHLKEDKYFEIAEEIIYQMTIFGDSKKLLKDKLEKYVEASYLSKADLKRIMGYKFKDWGRLSKELLNLYGIDKSTGEKMTILQAMWEYSLNFMEVISSELFTFKQVLEDKEMKSLKSLSDFEYEDMEELYFSAPVKRMIWQTILVIREIEQIMGNAPEKIFVEMTRSDEEKGDAGRKDSRGKELLECYKTIKNADGHDWKKEIKDADESGRLRSKKLFLYYRQMGRDAYTGKPIPINDLFVDNLYDIDHIYPRHYVKDDSLLNNLVLTNKSTNEHMKKDLYPLPSSIRGNSKVRELWEFLHEKGLMNDEKYRRLTCRNPFSDEQLAGFIARQMVETGQGTKGLTTLLKQLMPESKIVYVKAGNVSEFRRNGFLKSRLANDFHHAQDAYLNVVVGNMYYTKFTSNPMNFIRKEFRRDAEKYKYHLGKMLKYDIVRNGEVAWIAEKDDDKGTMEIVRSIMDRNTPVITRMPYDNKGSFYNVMPLSKHKAKKENYVPIKEKDGRLLDVTRYGGYNSLKPAYFIFIEYGTGKKRKKAFDVVPLYYADKIKTEENLLKYCEDILGYTNVRVIHGHLKKDSLIKLDGYYLYLAGLDSRKNVEFRNATSLCVKQATLVYIHAIEKSKNEGKIYKDITCEKNIILYDILTEKNTNGILKKSPIALGKILTNGRDKFLELELDVQVDILYRILSILSLSPANVSLAELGGPKEVGRIRISGNMTDRKEVLLIEQSATGLFERRTDLLKEE